MTLKPGYWRLFDNGEALALTRSEYETLIQYGPTLEKYGRVRLVHVENDAESFQQVGVLVVKDEWASVFVVRQDQADAMRVLTPEQVADVFETARERPVYQTSGAKHTAVGGIARSAGVRRAGRWAEDRGIEVVLIAVVV